MTSLDTLVDNWLRLDKNEATRNEVLALRQAGNTDELERRMRKRIEFGTAGLRGRMEAGWARMNDLIIIQASQGLCKYVLEHVDNAATRGVVVGHDHRYNSERWAQLTAASLIANGVKVYLHRGLVHTPLVPFSVKELNAAAGIMVTASHNPKQDNGYKVYWENAVQIISPHDAGIAASILANLEPQETDLAGVTSSSLCLDVTEKMKNAYFENLLKSNTGSDYKIKFVNTSMHGVGAPFVSRAFELFGFQPPVHVAAQQEPDPEFPTVAFPNPEEHGALNLALETANAENATYVLAQDPDADRFAAAEHLPDGTWHAFTGDQLGTLFAAHVFSKYRSSGKPLSKLAMVASTVSSKMVEAIALAEGFTFVECLTGFKYIGNTAMDLQAQGFEVPFGYEEAIGFMFGDTIRDKDGVSASVTFVQLVEELAKEGRTAKTFLTDLYRKYGYFETRNNYFICTEAATIDAIFTRIRSYDGTNARSYPTSIAGLTVTRVVDLTTGYDSANAPSYKPALPISSGHMIQFRAENKDEGVKIVLTVRTSGTEPKIKYYLEGSCKDASKVRPTLVQVVDELSDMWVQAKKNNLARP
ncbi:hypothetical protein CYLTODRAFT_345563 [Cylindrobasidium torrendii FP15055 ss-10]|uniref:Phosphoglucomutase 1 n=1 Tax=Cylindrobasidium torrendii FP15055 ss-10 TaxID=1314674 RepID=A0A0D7BPV7_9AGAR|nr:hypothetical protein CYLTODRAFT_345563 [Cylindrobasidium torrendii FP15055 ss-10]